MVALAQTRTDWLPRAGRITTAALVAGAGFALASAVAGALAAGLGLPLLLALSWPVEMRLVHALEITGTTLVQGTTIAWLLGSSTAAPRAHRPAALDAGAGVNSRPTGGA